MIGIEVIGFITTSNPNVFRVKLWIYGLLVENAIGATKELLMGNLMLDEETFNSLIEK